MVKAWLLLCGRAGKPEFAAAAAPTSASPIPEKSKLCLYASGSLNLDVAIERKRIATERINHETAYLKAEQACYARFAVSDCVRQARQDRRVALDALRRQELVLNDLDRKTRALATLERIRKN